MEELTPPYIQISKTFSSVSIILNVIGFFKGGHFRFGSVVIKNKSNQTKFFF
jgi:hypothetical protein